MENLRSLARYRSVTQLPKGREWLNSEDGYCAMGIACLLYQEATGRKFSLWMKRIPPKEVQDWYGLDSDQLGRIMELNDESDMNFDGIADFIRRHIIHESPNGKVTKETFSGREKDKQRTVAG